MAEAGNAEIVRVARGWLGTPYHHQMSCIGAGCDCLGLVRGVWRTLFHTEPFTIPAYSRGWGEADRDEQLLWRLSQLLRQKHVGEVEPGDVVLFRMRQGVAARHLGIQSNKAQFIHALERHGVVETRLSAPWQRRIVARFSYPLENR
ncbi:peptidase [Qingshengfaniella alkalisoli]|uniref:Peptidase n=2 Tax=Qingshengfaniella alkalisoli TaxID=2599296 RepID=A0A5B8IX84_9RHOB|nr:peptidase [Qingshengfaniella alkalisoli]